MGANFEAAEDGRLRAEGQPRPLLVRDLGLVTYGAALELQNSTAEAVARGALPDTLFLLEHPHTYTCGRRGGRDNILVDEQFLQRVGAEVVDVDRGGDITYHGPGQLVAYPVLQLTSAASVPDVHYYLRQLEYVVINTLRHFAITSYHIRHLSGVWTGMRDAEKKIAAVGVRVNGRGVTTHGLALNVTTDMSYFDHIVPCGILDKGVTSMEEVLGVAPTMPAVKSVLASYFLEQFGRTQLNFETEIPGLTPELPAVV